MGLSSEVHPEVGLIAEVKGAMVPSGYHPLVDLTSRSKKKKEFQILADYAAWAELRFDF